MGGFPDQKNPCINCRDVVCENRQLRIRTYWYRGRTAKRKQRRQRNQKSEQHHDDEWAEMQSSNAGMQMMAVEGKRGMCAGCMCMCQNQWNKNEWKVMQRAKTRND